MSVLAWSVLAHPVGAWRDRRLAVVLAENALLRMDNAELRAQNWALRDEQTTVVAARREAYEQGRRVGRHELAHDLNEMTAALSRVRAGGGR